MALRIFSVTSGTADPDAVARRGWWGTWIRAYRTIHLAEEIKVAAGGVLPVPIHIEILPLGVSADPSRSAVRNKEGFSFHFPSCIRFVVRLLCSSSVFFVLRSSAAPPPTLALTRARYANTPLGNFSRPFLLCAFAGHNPGAA